MKVVTPDPAVLAGSIGSSTTGAAAPGPQPGTPSPAIATSLPLPVSQVSTGAAPSLAPKSGDKSLRPVV
jgi:hypothetical protein